MVTDLIKRHEGFRLHPYECPAGKLTIGYGRNLDDRGITEKEADFLLQGDVSAITIELEKRLPFFSTLSPVRRAVLIDMAYNMGVSGLLSFQKTLAALEAGEFETASNEMMDSKWAEQVGARAGRLSWMLLSNQAPKLRGRSVK